MRRWRARGAWLPRLVRRWRPDGNPLRRTSDRIEAILLAILIAAFAAGALIAELFGAANLGTALGIGQIAFALALVYVLVRT